MQVCPNCGNRNRPGVVFCENCGASLIGDSPINTKNIGTKGLEGALTDLPPAEVLKKTATDVFGQETMLRLEISGVEPLLLKPKQETIFGRRDPATGAMPDVDLTPFAGYRMGVSRRHAVIRQTEVENRLDLIDLGSSNGTFLNGLRVMPNQPQRLRDGDEIRLGQMVLTIHFQAAPQPDTSTSTPAKPDAPAGGSAQPDVTDGPRTTQTTSVRSEPPAPDSKPDGNNVTNQ
jgi:pSer/pThr/pTyr-binding forkhead associated (FHA) protein